VPLGSRLLAVDFDLANISVLLQSPYAENKAERLTFHLFEVGDKIFRRGVEIRVIERRFRTLPMEQS
jgi:hypothetical protein